MNFGTAEPLKAPLGTAALAPRKRRVLPPASKAVHDARVAFCEAKRAAVDANERYWWAHDVAVHDALDVWIAAERAEREAT